MELVIAGWIGARATAEMAAENRDALLKRFPEGYVKRMMGADRFLLAPEQIDIIKSSKAEHVFEPGAYGIFGCFWDMAAMLGCGFEVDGRRLPFRQETIELCEALSLDPCRVDSRGCVLMVCHNGYSLREYLKDNNISAAITGFITSGNDKLIRYKDRVSYLRKEP